MTDKFAKYDTVYRHGRFTFTGVPIAKLHDGVWYWPDYQTAHDFALAFNLPTSCIREDAKGWVQAATAPSIQSNIHFPIGG